MEELRNLNDLNRGVHKQWIWGSKDNFYRSCDYLQKINYSIQDLNTEIKNLTEPTMKEVIFIIVLIDWICEAVNSIQELLRQDIYTGFIYKDDETVKKAKKYFKAIRSFVVAHPLNTTRHKDYGLNGDLICVDIRRKTPAITSAFSCDSDWFHLGFGGMEEYTKDKPSDFVLYVYSQEKDRMQFFKYVGANFSDLYCVAKLQIDKLYALDKYLGKLSRKKIGINE